MGRDPYTRGRDPYDAATARPSGDYVPVEELLALKQQLAATQAKLYNAENGPTWSNTTRIPSTTKEAGGSPNLLAKVREIQADNENLKRQKAFKQQLLLNKKSKLVKELVAELEALKKTGSSVKSNSTEAQIESYKKMISGLIKGHERKNEYIRELQRKLGMENPDVIRKPNAPKESAKPAKRTSPKTYALVPSKAKKAGKKAAPKKGKTVPLNPTAKSFKPEKAAAKPKRKTSPKAAKSPRTSPKAARTSPKNPKELIKELRRQNEELKKKNEGQQEFIRNSKAFMKKIKEEKQKKRS